MEARGLKSHRLSPASLLLVLSRIPYLIQGEAVKQVSRHSAATALKVRRILGADLENVKEYAACEREMRTEPVVGR